LIGLALADYFNDCLPTLLRKLKSQAIAEKLLDERMDWSQNCIPEQMKYFLTDLDVEYVQRAFNCLLQQSLI